MYVFIYLFITVYMLKNAKEKCDLEYYLVVR